MRGPRSRPSRGLLPAAALALAALAAAGGVTSGARLRGGDRRLEAGRPVTDELKPGAEHGFRLALAAGQFLRLTVNPGDGMVAATLSDPGGRTLAKLGGADDGTVRRTHALVTETSGVHRIVVRALGVMGARYEIRIDELRAATDADRKSLAAEAEYERGQRLERSGRAALPEAVAAYEAALAGWRAAGDLGGQARALGSLGAAHFPLGDARKATTYLEDKLLIVGRTGKRGEEAMLREDLGWRYMSIDGSKDRSLAHLEKARRLYEELRDPAGEARALTFLGQLHAEPPAPAPGRSQRDALDYYSQALAAYVALGNRYYEADLLARLMLTWQALKQSGPAIYFGKRAVNTYQELRAGMRDLGAKPERKYLKEKEDIYRELAALLVKEGRLFEAEEVLTMLKEEEFSRFIRSEGINASGTAGRRLKTGSPARDEEYRQIEAMLTPKHRQQINELSKKPRASWTPEEEKLFWEWKEIQKRIQNLLTTFVASVKSDLESRPPGSRKEEDKEGLEQLVSQYSLSHRLDDIGRRVVAIYTLVTEDKLILLLMRQGVITPYERPVTREKLRSKVMNFRDALAINGKGIPEVQRLGEDLYKTIIGPDADAALKNEKPETLMWWLDDMLRYVPVAALRDERGYLVENYRNSVLTPASLVDLTSAPSADWDGIGFGVSKEYLPDFYALENVPTELRGIFGEEAAGVAGVIKGRVMLNDKFTVESLQQELFRRPKVVHIASHFKLNGGKGEDNESSALLLGNGDLLPLRALTDGSWDFAGVELMTFSACSTAYGSDAPRGWEMDGLPMIVQLRGAKSIIATLWAIKDDSTQILMQEFYQARAARPGDTKAEALRRAQLALLRGDRGVPGTLNKPNQLKISNVPIRSHPYHWAAFVLVGNWK